MTRLCFELLIRLGLFTILLLWLAASGCSPSLMTVQAKAADAAADAANQALPELVDYYKQEGLDIVLKDAPDHIGVELEFMYFLALKEAEARADADPEQAACLRDEQASFLQTHLGTWVEALVDNIERNARTEFYKAIGRATKRLVLRDLAELAGMRANSEES